jgi:hypothetical protein
MGIVF